MQFATAIYGGLVMNRLFFADCKVSAHELALASSTEAVTKTLCAHCNVARDDVVYVDCHDTELDRTHQPGVAVVLDHATQSVVVAVRGTITLQDALTDLAASRAVLGAGHAHHGILKSAHNTLGKVEALLATLRQRYPNYPLKLVGHSLGAGVSVPCLFDVLCDVLCRDGGADDTADTGAAPGVARQVLCLCVSCGRVVRGTSDVHDVCVLLLLPSDMAAGIA